MNTTEIKNFATLAGSAFAISFPAVMAATTIKLVENKFGPKPAVITTLTGMAVLYSANKLADRHFRKEIAKLDLGSYMNK